MSEEQAAEAEPVEADAPEAEPTEADLHAQAIEALGEEQPEAQGEPEPEAKPDEPEEPAAEEKSADELAKEVFADQQKIKNQKRQLARRERQQEAKDADLARREAIVQHHEKLEALRQSDPMAWLEATGVDMRQLAERMVAGDQNPLEAKILELEKRLAERDERDTRAEDERRKELAVHSTQAAQQDIAQRFEAAAENYPELAEYAGTVIDATGENLTESQFIARSAWQHLLDHYERTGEELQLDNIFASMSEWAAERLPAVRARFAPADQGGAQQAAPQPKPAATNAEQPKSQTPVRTLTNSDSATRISEARDMTPEERREEALRVLNS